MRSQNEMENENEMKNDSSASYLSPDALDHRVLIRTARFAFINNSYRDRQVRRGILYARPKYARLPFLQ